MTDAPATAAPVIGLVSLSAVECILKVLGLAETARDAARAERDELAVRYCREVKAHDTALAAAVDRGVQLADMRARAELAEAQLAAVLDVLGRRKRAAYIASAAAVESDGEAAELAEARGRWIAQKETLAQVLRRLGHS